jgi:putative phosphoribosyl transferase
MAVGAIFGGTNPYTVINEDIARTMGITEADVTRIAKIQFEDLEHRRHLWLGGRQRISVVGRDAIVVDDGIATGASVRIALEVTRRESPARLILACPVVSADTAESLRGLCDDAIFLATPQHFTAVGEFYRDFRQISDGEVKHLLQQALG